MKKALPNDAFVAADARDDMERYALEFIQFITSEGESHPSIPLIQHYPN